MINRDRLRHLLDYDPETGRWTWLVSLSNRALAGRVAGSKRNDGYWRIRLDGRVYLAHRLAWFYMTGRWPANEIDHANGNRLDNRWANLRLATHARNMANAKRRKDSTTGFKGVSRNRGQYWAQIGGKGDRRTIGPFASPVAAHTAYLAAAREKYGDFARGA